MSPRFVRLASTEGRADVSQVAGLVGLFPRRHGTLLERRASWSIFPRHTASRSLQDCDRLSHVRRRPSLASDRHANALLQQVFPAWSDGTNDTSSAARITDEEAFFGFFFLLNFAVPDPVLCESFHSVHQRIHSRLAPNRLIITSDPYI